MRIKLLAAIHVVFLPAGCSLSGVYGTGAGASVDLPAARSALLVIAIAGGLGWANRRAWFAGWSGRRNIMTRQASLLIPQFILAEVTLSFPGIGIADPAPSLGNLRVPLREYAVLTAHWWMAAPALVQAVVLYLYRPD